MMRFRSILLAAAFALTIATPAVAQDFDEVPQVPTLRPQIMVSGEVVRIGDLVDNAGAYGEIAVFRSPDLGTTGTVPAKQVVEALRAHKVIGVDTKDIREVVVTRSARTFTAKDIEGSIARAISGKGGLGDAADLVVALDRDTGALQLDTAYKGELTPVAARFDNRNGRFDVTFEINNEVTSAPARLRFTGTAYETVLVAAPTRAVDRGDVLKAADVATERRPKADAGNDLASRDRALGMQMRRRVAAGQPLRNADLGKPDLVQRDQNVSIVYQTPGLYLTMRGKAIDGGAEGDTVSVTNLQSKRVVQGTVVGPGQVLVAPIAPTVTAATNSTAANPQPGSNE
jgi:flagella basal body P-ring formation protein FlgA